MGEGTTLQCQLHQIPACCICTGICNSTFLLEVVLPLSVTRILFKVLLLLKFVCMPYFLNMFQILSHNPWVYGMIM